MGGCCFTPRKTQLLWWYWLLLFSIVGIPMFAAALYVRSAARHGVIEPWQVRAASRIFWLGTCFFLVLFGWASLLVYGLTQLPGRNYWGSMPFVVSFLFWLMVAIGAARLTEKVRSRIARVTAVVFSAIVPAILAWWSWALVDYYWLNAIVTVPTSMMKFLVCMLPAHYWRRFTAAPSTKRAWLFLGALALGTAWFWAISKYGYDIHLIMHQRWWSAIGVRR